MTAPHPGKDAPRFLVTATGRRIGYQLFGAPAGEPVYFLHGFPGSRIQAELVAASALAADTCLVAWDRPGFGLSDPADGSGMDCTVDDLRELAAALGHSSIGVIGVSCGGAHALACAAGVPELVRHVGLLAGMGPMDLPGIRRGQLKVLTVMFALARRSPRLVILLLALDRRMFSRDPGRAVQALSRMLAPPDQALLGADPALAAIFARSLQDAYRQGLAGALREARLIGSPRPYALEDVDVPVEVWQGLQDRHVPPAMGRHIADTVRDGRWHPCPEDGHLSILIHRFPACLAAILHTLRTRRGLVGPGKLQPA